MPYKLYNPQTTHTIELVEDPAAYILEHGLVGYLVQESTFQVEYLPQHAPDPGTRLAAGRTFGAAIIEEFRTAATAAELDLDTSEYLRGKLGQTEYWLREGHIAVAREAMERVDPIPGLFPATTKQDYLARIDAYLAS